MKKKYSIGTAGKTIQKNYGEKLMDQEISEVVQATMKQHRDYIAAKVKAAQEAAKKKR